MALDIDDPLLEPFPDGSLNERMVAWLWLHLDLFEDAGLEECSINSDTMRKRIAKALMNDRVVKRKVTSLRDSLLPEETFSWVKKSGRQPKWLIAQALKTIELPNDLRLTRSGVFQTLSDKGQLIALIDLWNASFDLKVRELNHLQSDWNRHTQSDVIFTWFKGKDESAKCGLAWSWLKKNKPRQMQLVAPFTKLTELLDFFDHCGASHEEKELYIEKIKKRWSTQKTREKAVDKKQYNFVLPLSINAVLDKLAEEHQLSRTKVLEHLILSEAQHELYLSQNM